MPKIKTHKGTAKRITLTKNGKLKRRQAMQSHNLAGKTTAKKRALSRPADVASADAKRTHRLINK
jgi:large subunit ribosomal protein L35